MLHWGIFPPHHFLAVWRSEPPFIHGLRHSESSCHTFNLAFKATSPVFGVQSHHSFSVSTFRASLLSFGAQSHVSLRFGVQSHHHFLVWRSESHSRFRRSEPSSHLRSAFRAIVITSQCWHSEPSLSLFSFGVQSHHCRFWVLAFRAIIGFQFDVQIRISQFDVQCRILNFQRSEPPSSHFWFRRSEPSSVFSLTFRVTFLNLTFRVVLLVFDVQSHHHFSVSAFRAIIVLSVWCSESSSSPLSSAFRATSSFDVQSHYIAHSCVQSHVLLCSAFQNHISVSAFRAIIAFSAWRWESHFQFWRSGPSSSYFQFGVQSHHLSSVWHSEPLSLLSFKRSGSRRSHIQAFRVIISP